MSEQIDKLREKLRDFLVDYQLQYHSGVDDSPYSLVDHLTPAGEQGVEKGRAEIFILADDILEEIWEDIIPIFEQASRK